MSSISVETRGGEIFWGLIEIEQISPGFESFQSGHNRKLLALTLTFPVYLFACMLAPLIAGCADGTEAQHALFNFVAACASQEIDFLKRKSVTSVKSKPRSIFVLRGHMLALGKPTTTPCLSKLKISFDPSSTSWIWKNKPDVFGFFFNSLNCWHHDGLNSSVKRPI